MRRRSCPLSSLVLMAAAIGGCSSGDYEASQSFGGGPFGYSAEDTGSPATAGETAASEDPTGGSTAATAGMATGSGSVGSTGAAEGSSGAAPGTTGGPGEESGDSGPGEESGPDEPPPITCGDAKVDPGEQCDDGNGNNTDACLSSCDKATCGDGAVYAGVEQCDASGPSAQCNANCTTSKCGDGVVNAAAGEDCDTGGASGNCDADCTSVKCGDGALNAKAGEQCDDGNANNGDGCSATCKEEPKGPKQCDQGNDPGTGAPWVVCTADANSAWISSNPEGQYHIVKICQDLGYSKVGEWGGTAGAVCGVNQANSSCMNLGQKVFTQGAWKGTGNCGQDGLGPIVCKWVQWTCLK